MPRFATGLVSARNTVILSHIHWVHLLAGVLVLARHNRMLRRMERVKLLLVLVLGELLAAWSRLHLQEGGQLERVLGPAGTERLGLRTCAKAVVSGASTGQARWHTWRAAHLKKLLGPKLIALPI